MTRSSSFDLKAHLQNQNSQTGATVDSSGIYATAWLEHGSTTAKYGYPIVMITDSYKSTATTIWRRKHRNQLVHVHASATR